MGKRLGKVLNEWRSCLWGQSMKFLKIMAVIAVVFVAGMSIAVKVKNDQHIDTPDQIQNARKFYEREVLLKTPKCSDPIIVTIAGITLKMPRYGEYTLNNGGKLTDIDHHCDIKRLNDVQLIQVHRISLASTKFFNKAWTWDAEIKKLRSQGNVRMLANGIENVYSAHSSFFIIPTNLISTYDKKPAIFYCTAASPDEFKITSFCGVGYLYKKDLSLGYTYFATEYGFEDQVKADIEQRKFLESLIVKGK
jgi:hypothetical protein